MTADAAGIADDRKGWLFRTARRHNGSVLSDHAMSQPDAFSAQNCSGGGVPGKVPRLRSVQLWDRGYWEPDGTQTPEEALASGDFKFILAGQRLEGDALFPTARDGSAASRAAERSPYRYGE